MPKDYKNIKPRGKPPSSFLSHFLSLLTGLSIGLLVALYTYLYLPRPGSTELPVPAEPTGKEQVQAQKPGNKKESVPEPRFDFYKILPNREINISEWIADNQEKDQPTPDGSDLYVFQVGSFKDYESADQVKAQLALIGIKADIQRVVINGQDSRHRVRIGPYKDRKVLSDIGQRLNSNGLEYMLLKLRIDEGVEG